MKEKEREQLGLLLSAYLDGELDLKQTNLVERALRESAEARAVLADLKAAAGALHGLPRHAAPNTIVDEVQAQIERMALIEVSSSSAPPWAARRSPWKPALSLAAMLTFVVCGTWLVSRVYRADDAAKSPRFENVTAEIASPSPPDGAERAAGTADVLLASASLEQKLSAGLGVEAVTQHNFANEQLRLQFVVNDQRELTSVTRQLDTLLSSQLAAFPEAAEQQPQDAGVPDHFYFRGRAHVNYPESNMSQILVRAPREELEAIIERASDVAPRDEAVVLQAGPLEVPGRANVQNRFRGDYAGQGLSSRMADAATRPKSAHTSRPRDLADSETDATVTQPIDELLKIVGISPEALSTPPSVPASAVDTLAEAAGRTTESGIVGDADRESAFDESLGPAGPPSPAEVGQKDTRMAKARDDKTEAPSVGEGRPGRAATSSADDRNRPATMDAVADSDSMTGTPGSASERPSIIERKLDGIERSQTVERRRRTIMRRPAEIGPPQSLADSAAVAASVAPTPSPAGSATMVIEVLLRQPPRPAPVVPPKADAPSSNTSTDKDKNKAQ